MAWNAGYRPFCIHLASWRREGRPALDIGGPYEVLTENPLITTCGGSLWRVGQDGRLKSERAGVFRIPCRCGALVSSDRIRPREGEGRGFPLGAASAAAHHPRAGVRMSGGERSKGETAGANRGAPGPLIFG